MATKKSAKKSAHKVIRAQPKGTSKQEERFGALDRARTDFDQVLDFMLSDEGEVWLAGIPRRGDLEKLKTRLHQSGHSAVTTEGRAPASIQAG